MNCNFLLNMLKRMGFGNKWVKWIRFCISTVKFSVLINVALEGFFTSSRGLRQGDPLSPFLFLIVMEGLNNVLLTTHENHWLRGLKSVTNKGTVWKSLICYTQMMQLSFMM